MPVRNNKAAGDAAMDRNESQIRRSIWVVRPASFSPARSRSPSTASTCLAPTGTQYAIDVTQPESS